MNTSPTENGGSSLLGSWQYGMLNTRTDHRTTNTIYGHSNSNVGNVSNSYNNTINVGIEEESLRIQEWLSPLEPNKRHRDVRDGCLDGVGEWVLRRSEFESWYKSQNGLVNRTLLCYGGQGVGKTYISSLVIDTLRKQTRGQNMAVIFLYCDYQAHKGQSAVNMIGSLVRQAALRALKIPSEIKSAFDESKQEGGHGLQLPDMVKLFVKVIGYMEVVYLCVDAVDEVLPQHRLEFLRALRQILQDAPNVRLFLTGRRYIRAELDKHLTEKVYAIHIVADQRDITRYLSKKMKDDSDQDPSLMTEDLKNNIMKTMLEKASEMFLLVALNIEAILGETSLAKRKQMLQKVATTGVGLDSVYAQTLQQIKEQKGDRSRLGMEVLMWVSHAERPLRIDELCHALAVDMQTTDLDPENIRPQDTVIGSCLGLVVIDAETSTVRLIHYTLQEYLSRHCIFPNAHKILGQTCLVYLNYKEVKGLPANGVSNLGDLPFLTYSSLYWGSHAKIELSDPAKSLALELLNRFENHISVTLLIEQIGSFHSCSLPRHLWPSLHRASYFGIVEVVATLIEIGGCDINQSDCMGFTAFMWAAHQGNEGVVRLLLARSDVNTSKPDNHGRTPLWRASGNGHEGVVKLLLARNKVDPNRPDIYGKTPLWGASWGGHSGVVELLLARGDVNPNKPSKDGRTPLRCAAEAGHEGVVKLLLARNDVNPNEPDNRGETALWRASYNGHEGVVKLLLERNDVSPERPDNHGRTPLWAASHSGHDRVVRLLLARNDVSPEKPSTKGQTPLWAASHSGHEGVVKLLLARNNVNPSRPDIEGKTPLWGASFYGYEGVVELLLARSDVNPNKPNNDGRTPLWCASYNGHEGVVKLLLARNNVNPDRPDIYGRTPLWGASWGGHEGAVNLLLARDDVNPDMPNNDGQTPLRCAAHAGHEGVVKLLLSRNDVNPNKPDNDGHTPFWCASFRGHEGVVKLLLARNDINPDKSNNDGQTPLWAASYDGHELVVKLLLARNDVNPDKPSNNGQTPLLCASCNGHEGVVKLLLARNEVNLNKPNNSGETPLWHACFRGNEGVLKLLLERDDINPDKPNNDGRTPLWTASSRGHEGVVKLLLARNDVNPDMPNNDGRTPLWTASSRGHEGVVKLLLARNDVNPDKPSNDGRTPLRCASCNGHEGVVKLLKGRCQSQRTKKRWPNTALARFFQRP